MQWIMKICARGALGLGAAALLLSGVPAHANPASGAASRESQPRLLAQSTAQPGEAEKLEQQRLKEQQDRAKMQQEQKATTEATGDEEDAGADAGGGAAQCRQVSDLAPGLSGRVRNP